MSRLPTLLLLLTLLIHGTSTAQWSELGSGMSTGGVRALIYDSTTQRLYAFGRFVTAGGITVNGTAYWENEAWHPMGLGVHPGAPILSANVWGDSILIAGSFHYAFGVPNSRKAALWDGSSWNAIEVGGTNSYLAAVLEREDDVLIAGSLDTIAGVPIANNIARYSNGEWSSVGIYPTDGDLRFTNLVEYQGKYILGCNLNSPSLRELCCLDGDTLRRVGEGIRGDAWVNDLLEYQGKLFIAGEYYAGWGNAATGLSTWDGSEFADPFPGVESIGQTDDLDLHNGELYFSGRMRLPGSLDYYTLGRYDGTRLCLFGKNLNTVFRAIAATEEYLVVAPNMCTLGLGGDTVNCIVRWDLSYLGDTCIQIATSISEHDPVSDAWSIGPSPFLHRLNISCSNGIPVNSSLQLLDASGRLLYETRLGWTAPGQDVAIDTGTGPSGVLLAVIRSGTGTVLAQKRLLRLAP